MAITHWRLKMSLCSVQLEGRTQGTGTQSCSSPPRGIDSKNQKSKTIKATPTWRHKMFTILLLERHWKDK